MKEKKRKIFLSDEEKRYYKGSIERLVQFLRDKGPTTTSHIMLKRRDLSLAWEWDNRPKMLQVLKTLQRDGVVERIDKGMNFTYWKIKEV